LTEQANNAARELEKSYVWFLLSLDSGNQRYGRRGVISALEFEFSKYELCKRIPMTADLPKS